MIDDVSADELAGVVDLFGALTPSELERALSELAFKRGAAVDSDAVAEAIDDAVASYVLARYDHEGETFLSPGPVAFPALPENAEDLPHILDIPKRTPEREHVGHAVAERLRADAARAIDDGDDAEMRRLLDVTYDVAVWSDAVAVDDIRERLDDALGGDTHREG